MQFGDKVLLSTKNLTLKKGHVKKFSPKSIGPFKVLEIRSNGTTYKLEMPSMDAQLHPVFHVSLVKKDAAHENGRYSRTAS